MPKKNTLNLKGLPFRAEPPSYGHYKEFPLPGSKDRSRIEYVSETKTPTMNRRILIMKLIK